MRGGTARLRVDSITKTFPGVRAIDDVSFEVYPGEILGLVGVNGAGKSTLMNVLGGVFRPDAGRITVDGEEVAFHSPKDAERHGIAFIHQELLSFESQTVAENVFIGHIFGRPGFPFLVDKKKTVQESRKYLEMLGSDIDPTARMETLPVGGRQVVEVARALTLGSDVMIFDEPTSSLSAKEREALFRVIRKLRDEGKAVIYISHFLDEVMELCDRFVVLRNGRVHGSGMIEGTTKSDIIESIVGREVFFERKAESVNATAPALRIERLSSSNVLRDINFTLHQGEILGVWGLMGSGRTEMIRALLGFDPADSCDIFVFDHDKPTKVTSSQLRKRCGYLTESRKADGLFLKQTIARNISAAALDRYAPGPLGIINSSKEQQTAVELMSDLRIAAVGPKVRVSTLSGGNQQKVVIAKWLNRRPQIMIMDEPTRGVDVGAKLEIGNLIKKLAAEGTPVLLVTSDLEEMISLADRVIVLRSGSVVGEATGETINSIDLTAMCLGEMKRAF